MMLMPSPHTFSTEEIFPCPPPQFQRESDGHPLWLGSVCSHRLVKGGPCGCPPSPCPGIVTAALAVVPQASLVTFSPSSALNSKRNAGYALKEKRASLPQPCPIEEPPADGAFIVQCSWN